MKSNCSVESEATTHAHFTQAGGRQSSIHDPYPWRLWKGDDRRGPPILHRMDPTAGKLKGPFTTNQLVQHMRGTEELSNFINITFLPGSQHPLQQAGFSTRSAALTGNPTQKWFKRMMRKTMAKTIRQEQTIDMWEDTKAAISTPIQQRTPSMKQCYTRRFHSIDTPMSEALGSQW